MFTRHQGVAFDMEPREFWDICPRFVFSKYPLIYPIKVESPEIAFVSPFIAFIWMPLLSIFLYSVKHPLVEFVEDLAGYHFSVVVCPTSYD